MVARTEDWSDQTLNANDDDLESLKANVVSIKDSISDPIELVKDMEGFEVPAAVQMRIQKLQMYVVFARPCYLSRTADTLPLQ